MGIPNFFIIGAPKCGTTSLYEWLAQHPQVNAPHKEPCFFSQDIESTAHLPTHISTLEDYKAIFSTDDPAILVSGEATPKYLYSDYALDQIRELRPDAKIIICLRDPADLAVSFHNQKVQEGVEREVDFSRAWARNLSSVSCVPDTMGPWCDGKINYLFWISYGRRLEKVFNRFPRQNVRVYMISEFKSAPEAIYLDLCRFLEISDEHRIILKAKNVGYRMRYPRLHIAVVLIKRVTQPLLRPILRVLGWKGLGVMSFFNRFNRIGSDYAYNMSEDMKEGINKLLEEDQALVSRLLGRKL